MLVICGKCRRELDADMAKGVCPYCGDLLDPADEIDENDDLLMEISSIRKTRALLPEERITGKTIPLRRKAAAPSADESPNRESKDLNKRVTEAISRTVARYAEIPDTARDEEQYSGASDGSNGIPRGTIIHDRYRIEKTMGVGGFGITYKVWDTKDDVYRALKEFFQDTVARREPGSTRVIVTSGARREEFEYGRKRLLNEAQIVAKFTSPNIVRVNDFFEENGTSYMVMEFIHGKTFENYISERGHKLTAKESIDLGVKICNALEEIHRSGVVHRDIAPDNIFIGDNGTVKIIDFGSARLSKNDTDDRMITLKRGFAPPEQYSSISVKNDRQLGWVDVYALGATLYYGLTGKVPEESIHRVEVGRDGKDALRDPMELNPDIPEFLNNTIMTAMAVNIEDRFQSAAEMRDALLQHRKILSVKAARKKRRMRKTAGVAGSFALIAILLAGGIIRYEMRKKAVVLNDATVSVWYAVSSDQSQEEQMNAVMKKVESNLTATDKFKDVEIELRAIPENQYEDELKWAYQAGRMPVLYQVPERAEQWMKAEDSIPVADVLAKLEKNGYSCCFMNDNQDIIDAQIGVPIGFNVPMIYINKELVLNSGVTYDFELTSVDQLTDICDGDVDLKLCVNYELSSDYCYMIPGFDKYLSAMYSLDTFLNKEKLVYFGNSEDYERIRDEIDSLEVLTVGSESVKCIFTNYWNVTSDDKDTVEAAEEVLAYLYSNEVQDIYYLQNTFEGLPLSEKSIRDYAEIRGAFTEALSHIETFSFRYQ